nr:MAG TPA: hypothetical protein [Caudoviricetes sp.]
MKSLIDAGCPFTPASVSNFLTHPLIFKAIRQFY